MQKKQFGYLIFILFIACQSNQKNEAIEEIPKSKEDTVVNQTISEEKKTVVDTLPKPSIPFQEFTLYLDSIGYSSDTIRARKIATWQNNELPLILVNNKPFFKIDPSNHHILSSEESLKGNYRYDSLTVNYLAFKKAISIFTYYYRENVKSKFIADGTIEEWNFKTDTEAKAALRELDKIKDLYYFNTRSYSFQADNYMYIFHTRASAFELPLKRIYTKFRERRIGQ